MKGREATAGVKALEALTHSAADVCSCSGSERRAVGLARRCGVTARVCESGPLASKAPGMTLNADR